MNFVNYHFEFSKRLNYYVIQEQNGRNGSTSNGNGCPVRDPYEDMVTLDILLIILINTQQQKNIAWGTTDPGYWVYNLNHVSDWNQFEIILAEKDHSSYGLNTLGPLCLWQCFLLFSEQSLSKEPEWLRRAEGRVFGSCSIRSAITVCALSVKKTACLPT